MTTTPRTWVVGEVVTAALMNQEIRDQFNAVFGAWTAYTPTWTAASGTTTVGDGLLAGRYLKIGRTVDFAMRFQWGSTTSQSVAAANWSFGLPAAPYAGGGSTWQYVAGTLLGTTENARWFVAGNIDTGAATITGITAHADGGFMDNQEMPSQTASTTTTVQPGSRAWATGDRLNLWGRYEAAA